MGSGLPPLVAAAGGVLEFAEHGATPGWSSPTAPRHRRRRSAGCSPDPPSAAGWPRGALATARARDWGAVYDQLLDDYRAAMVAKAGGAGGVREDGRSGEAGDKAIRR